MRNFSIILFFVSLIFGCDTNDQLDKNLEDIDNRLVENYADSAFKILSDLDTTSMTKVNKAYCNMLISRSATAVEQRIMSDSLADVALSYFKANKAAHFNTYIRALITKANAQRNLKNYSEAMNYNQIAIDEINHHKNIDPLCIGEAYYNLAMIHMKSYSLDFVFAPYFRKALYYFEKSGDKKRIAKCLSIFGASYRFYNMDSAYIYMDKALDLATKINDKKLIYTNLGYIARAYYTDSLYEKSKQISLYVYNNGGEFYPREDIAYDLCRIYTKLGQLDSAEYYLKQMAYSENDKEKYCIKLNAERTIAIAKNDWKKAYEIHQILDDVATAIVDNENKMKLLYLDRNYEATKLDAENSKIKTTQAVLIVIVLSLLIIIATILFFIAKRRNRIKDLKILIEELRLELNRSAELIDSKNSHTHKCLNAIVNMTNKLSAIPSHHKDLNKEYSSFRKSIRQSEIFNEMKDELRMNINLNYNNIIDRIEKSSYQLTSTEIDAIIYTLSGFDKAAIALWCNFGNIRSVYNLKYSISKKLNLQNSFDDFIDELRDDKCKLFDSKL